MTRGDIWWADFGIPFGSEPGYLRPVLVIQDDAFNRSRINTVIVIPLSTNLLLGEAPGNVFIEKKDSGLSRDSVIVVSQLTAIDRFRLIKKAHQIPRTIIEKTETGIKLILAIV